VVLGGNDYGDFDMHYDVAPIGEVFDQTKGMWVPIATTGLDPQTLPEAEAVRVPGGLILAGGLRDIDDIDVNNQPNNDIFPPHLFDEFTGRWFRLPHGMLTQRTSTKLVMVQ